MKYCISLLLLSFLSSVALAAPNYVDCTNASSPLVDKGTGPQGFGTTYSFPDNMTTVQNFVYSKTDEKAWMNVIVDGSVYRAVADCRQKINRGVHCKFDLSLNEDGSTRSKGAMPLTEYMTRLYASVIDTDLDKDLVNVYVGMDDESTEPTHPIPYVNMIEFNNSWIGNCKSKDVIEQG